MTDEEPSGGLAARAAAWGVHAFSASGAVVAVFAMIAVQQHRLAEAMLWLFAALVIDGVDGTLARAARVKSLAARIDGDALDLVIDYLNYVFVPTFFILEADLLPEPLELPFAALIQLASVYVFARRDMKTDDGYFRGFPALWNVIVLYLYAAGIEGAAAAVIVAVLVLLTFAPTHVIHPFRARDWGVLPPLLATAWAASTLALLFELPGEVRGALFVVSSATALGLIMFGLVRTVRGDVSRRQSAQ